MCTHSKKFGFFRAWLKKLISGAILIFLSTTSGYSQEYPVSITFSVLPPYTPDILKEYQQLSATLVSSSPVECFVIASLEGEGGIHIYSQPGYKPPAPILLMPNMPYTLDYSNWQETIDLDLVNHNTARR